MSDKKHYTWEEKIDSLAELAKAAGRYLDAEEEMMHPSKAWAYYKDAREKLLESYAEFCEWRHEEPYVVDEIKALLSKEQES